MGENETAGFDPIFFFHHAFVDYVFWKWQVRHKKTAAGSLDLISGRHPPFPGTYSTGLPGQQVFTELTLSTPLTPFVKPDGIAYTSLDVVDIVNQLGYEYGPGSLDMALMDSGYGAAKQFKIVRNINREKIEGSFVIRTYATGPDGTRVEIGREAILSRWSVARCANCVGKTEASSIVPIYPELIEALDQENGGAKIKYEAEIDTRSGRAARLGGLSTANAAQTSTISAVVEDL
jgi:tyrosinase